MNRANSTFWVFTTLVGWLCFGQSVEAAVGGLVVGIGFSILVTLFL